MNVFRPELQDRIYENTDRIFFGRAPVLKHVAEAFNKDVVITWIIQQYEYMNSRAIVKQLTFPQLEELSLLTFINANFFKTSEIQYFILKIRLGTYGDWFGCVDIQRIMVFLQGFIQERNKMYADYSIREQKERQEIAREQYRKGAVSRQRFIQMVQSGEYKCQFNK